MIGDFGCDLRSKTLSPPQLFYLPFSSSKEEKKAKAKEEEYDCVGCAFKNQRQE